MLKILLPFLASLVTAYAQSSKCCMTNDIQGTYTDLRSVYNNRTKTYSITEENGKVYFSISQRRRVYDRVENGNRIRQLLDFKQGRRYVITNETVSCEADNFFWPADDCVAGTSTLLKTTTIGSPSGAIDVNVWKLKFGEMTHINTVTKEGCYLVGQSWHGWNGQMNVEGSSRISDLTVGVNDTSVFDIPDMCNSEPRKCCFPSNWTATIVELGGQRNLAQTHETTFHDRGTITVDATNEILATDTLDSSTGVRTQVVQAYNTGVLYFVSGGTCFQFPSNATFPACIPDSAKFITSTYMGNPFKSIKINIWEYMQDGFKIRSAVTANDCSPVFDTVDGTALNF